MRRDLSFFPFDPPNLSPYKGRFTVYCFVDTEGSALYVGKSTNFLERFSRHRLKAPWFGASFEVWVDFYSTVDEMDAVENAEILSLHPRNNRAVKLFPKSLYLPVTKKSPKRKSWESPSGKLLSPEAWVLMKELRKRRRS